MTDNSKEIFVDHSIIAILPADTANNWIFKQGEPTTLSDIEMQEIEKMLNDCMSNYNLEQEKQFEELSKTNPDFGLDKQDFIINLKKYKRQYIASINENGEKVVWVNCFCDNFDIKWKNDIVFVLDGGNCYFNLKINLTTKEYFEFMVNGEA
jgi:hypothetical protein